MSGQENEIIENKEPDWASIRAEYLKSNISLKKLGEKHGVSLSAMQKKSAQGKWSEKRKQLRADKAEKVSERLHERDVKQTVKDIERVCRTAGKLIDKVNKALAQIDKQVYVSQDRKIITTKETKNNDGSETLDQTVKRNMRVKRFETLIDTKKLADLSKTLLNIKAVLTGEDGSADDTENSGIILINGQELIDDRPDEDSTAGGMETAAEAGADAAQS